MNAEQMREAAAQVAENTSTHGGHIAAAIRGPLRRADHVNNRGDPMTHFLTNPDRIPFGQMPVETQKLMHTLADAGAKVDFYHLALGWGIADSPHWRLDRAYRINPTPDPLAIGTIILHDGRPCPVPGGSRGMTWLRDGAAAECSLVALWWHHTGHESDIIAYRIDSLPGVKPTDRDILRQCLALTGRGKGKRALKLISEHMEVTP